MLRKFLFLILLGFTFLWGAAAQGQIQANFSFSTPGDSCKSRTVQFNASSSTGAIASYEWEFRNITTGASLGTGAGINITKNFLNPGLYEATLRVTGGGNSSSKTVQFRVYKLPEVNFSTDIREGCLPLSVAFQDGSSAGDGTIVRWEWNYNDGKKDVFTAPNAPTHEYLSGGYYTPTLIVTNSFGCTSYLAKDSLVRVYNKITPSFLVRDNYSCNVPHTVNFENTSLLDGTFNYTWNFGDGSSASSNDTFVSHEYTQQGIYSIRLTATNAPGNCSSYVQGSGVKNVYVGKPVADFNLAPHICVGSNITLSPNSDNTSLSNAGKWFFEDDNSVYNGRTGYHRFNREGIWKVKYVTFNTYSGCYSDTAVKEVEVLPSPTPDFTMDYPYGCQVPHTVHFTNTSLDASSYEWTFGDGTPLMQTTDAAVFSKSFNTFSTFAVRLRATNAAGCSTDKTLYVRNQRPSLTIDHNPQEGCMPLQVTVRATPNSNDPVLKYVYDFGNGVIDTVASAQHSGVYPDAGNYTLKVKLITAQGCVAESPSRSVSVIEVCDDDGSGGGGGGGGGGGAVSVGRGGDCNQKYTFTFFDTLTTAEVVSWDFDGDLVVTNTNPITYTFPDNVGKKRFLVTVTLRDLLTNAVIEHKKRVVVVDEKADFIPDKLNICKGINIDFKTLGIDSSNIVMYTWDFGDSTARRAIDNAAYFRNYNRYLNGNTSYTYRDTGVFYPKLIIEDKFGCKDSIQYPLPVVVKGPVAKFVIDSNSFCKASFEVTFTDSSKANGATPITQWNWNFGDNTSLTLDKDSIIAHRYNNTSYYRNYTATLTITDALGCSDSYQQSVTSYVPRANFYTYDTLRCGKFNIFFYNNSSAYVSNYNQFLWKYGNGISSRGYHGSHTFADTGKYSITLVVTDDGGCVDSITRSNYVKLVKPEASFSIGSDTSKCIGTFSLPFTSTSTYGKTYQWDFGDGESSATDKVEVSHFYEKADIYNVRLIVTGLDGCKDTISKPVKIKGPNGELSIKDNYLCLGESMEEVVRGKNIKEYYWDFGDLSSTSHLTGEDSVTHVYATAGKYLPNVILLSPEGCQITLSSTDSVNVDDIDAGPAANIECGDTHTMLRGTSALNIPGNYIWEGPSGVAYLPDNNSLDTQVDIPGKYVLKLRNGLCSKTDTVEVTTSGVVPTADAGPDKKLDCISGEALLNGSTTTPDTQLKWTGPAIASFVPNAFTGDTRVLVTGKYVLTVTQKFCTHTDTVEVFDCSLNPQDTSLVVCANEPGAPPRYVGYDLSPFNNHVVGSVASNITWYHDSSFINQVADSSSVNLITGRNYFAKITSLDGTETARAKVSIQVAKMPFASIQNPTDTICETAAPVILTDTYDSANEVYEWYYNGTMLNSSASVKSFHLSAPDSSGIYILKVYNQYCSPQYDTVWVKIYAQDQIDAGPAANIECGDTHTALNGTSILDIPGSFIWEGPAGVAYLPDNASPTAQVDIPGQYVLKVTNGLCEISDTVEVTTSGVVPTADAGTDQKLDCISGIAFLNGSTTTADTRLKWTGPSGASFTPDDNSSQPSVILTGKYVLTVTQKYCTATDTIEVYPCSLNPTDSSLIVCANQAGSPPRYDGYNLLPFNNHVIGGVNSNVSWYHDENFIHAVADPAAADVVSESDFFARITSPDGTETGRAKISMQLAKMPLASIQYSKDTICETDGPIVIAGKHDPGNEIYEWYHDGKLFSRNSVNNSFSLYPPDSSGMYVLKVSNPHCAPSYDSVALKIYEQAEAFFNEPALSVEYSPGRTLELPLQVKPLQHDTIESITWTPFAYLGYFTGGTFHYLSSDTSIQRPLYLTQNEELSSTYSVTVTTGVPGKGCSSTASVEIINYVPISVPNAFSPNHDGLNDFWIIKGLAKYPDTKIKLFNRWGNLLYESERGYPVPWDGTSNGTKVPFGTYYYVLELLGSRDKTDYTTSGWLLIVE